MHIFSLLVLFYSAFAPLLVNAAEPDADDTSFETTCRLTIGTVKYDLSKLAGEKNVSRTRETPPTSMIDTLRFNLCAELTTLEGVAERDQCPSGTRACLTKTNRKEDADTIVAVIPIAQTSSLKPEYSSLTSPNKGLSLILHGPTYLHPITQAPTSQSLNLTLLCANTVSEPTFTAYEGNSVMQVEWSAPAGCAVTDEDGGKDGGDGNKGQDKDKDKDTDQKNVGSGIGWFFLVLLLSFVAYFGLGAYYNYSTYGASGTDLIPHRDFWKEVPYMFRDVVSHLCSTVRPRHTSSRGGYIAV